MRGDDDSAFRAVRLLTFILNNHFVHAEPVSQNAAMLLMKRLEFMLRSPQLGLETYLYGERTQGLLWPDMPVLVIVIQKNVEFSLIETPLIELLEGCWRTDIDHALICDDLFDEDSFEGDHSYEWFSKDIQKFC